MNSLKSAMKELQATAAQLAESRGLQPDELPCHKDALLILAVAALKNIEKDENIFLSSSEIVAAAKSARNMLRPYLPCLPREEGKGELRADKKRGRVNAHDNNSDDDENEDLGQYSHTKVFDGNAKKRAKFARLMGGGKGEGSHHNTFAADASTIKRINGELEDQFNTALSRLGKKGLGA
ncbi:hypothetical protein TcCL_NonESM01785 [Trypanosoma cruzi]|nr:hypothetical protein TcCL_NonESM01785 [Trypanosoma cruzi]